MNTQRTISLIGICIGVGTVAMLWSAIYAALPNIQYQLHASALQAQWVVNIYGVLITSTLVFFGRLADRWGYRPLFIIGLILVIISCIGSAVSLNVTQLIICQALFGLSAGIILPISQALISHIYPEDYRGAAIGIWGMAVGLSMAVGPFVGGIIVGHSSWRALFALISFFSVLGLIILIVYCPRHSQEKNNKPLDGWGAMVLGMAIATFIIAIDELHMLSMMKDLMIFGLAIILFVLLIFIEKKAKSPMLCPRLWSNRNFLMASSASFCLLATIWGTFYISPHLMQNVLHLSPAISGVLMLGITLPLSLCTLVGGKYLNKLNPRLLMTFGFILFFLSYILQMHFRLETSFVWILSTFILIGAGWGLIWTPSTVIAISTLGPQDTGLASGSLVTMQEMGGTLGLACAATLMRSAEGFAGFHLALWVLVLFSLLGFIMSCFVK